MIERERVERLRKALEQIVNARDYNAEHGSYPPDTLKPDQEFDDWAADVAQAALAETSVPWVVRNRQTGLYWSNQWGWGSLEGCERFGSTQFNLPIGGEWVRGPDATPTPEE